MVVSADEVVREVPVSVPADFVETLKKDPTVVDWFIEASDNAKTRDHYIKWLAKFLAWTGWTVDEIFRIKREAMRNGEPVSDVERQIRRFHETLRVQKYSGKYRAQAVAAMSSLLNSKGYTLKRRLVRLDISPMLEMRVPEQKEVEVFVSYARGMQKKLLYTMMTDTPCRPRVFPAIQWNWLEEEWWTKDVVHVILPKQFRPIRVGPRKFEPICFLGPKTVALLTQKREAHIKAGKIPFGTDQVLGLTYPALLATVSRDYDALVNLGLIRSSRTDQQDSLIEQPIVPKSWRKYQFNIIDSLTEISPEWRKMLKGRDLQTERYYSKENIEALRKIYRDKIYPQLWHDTATHETSKEVDTLRNELQQVKQDLDAVLEITGLIRRQKDTV